MTQWQCQGGKEEKKQSPTGSQLILTSESYYLLPKTDYSLLEKTDKNNFVPFRLNQATLWKPDFGMLLASLFPSRKFHPAARHSVLEQLCRSGHNELPDSSTPGRGWDQHRLLPFKSCWEDPMTKTAKRKEKTKSRKQKTAYQWKVRKNNPLSTSLHTMWNL